MINSKNSKRAFLMLITVPLLFFTAEKIVNKKKKYEKFEFDERIIKILKKNKINLDHYTEVTPLHEEIFIADGFLIELKTQKN
jgi:hypothetical protein